MGKLKIYNTLSRELEEFKPLEENKVKVYVCGPTVYDHAHLGHARCYIIWDVITRYLRFKGYDVTYVRNITDVDDKIINKAKAANSTTEDITKIFINEFEQDMNMINVAKPDIEPKATEFINEMIDLTKTLVDKGHAYVKDGDVFFRVDSYKEYGELSHQNIDDLQSGARIETDTKKENPMDFALWKSVTAEDEITWDSPWGKGRPGWHTECCAMIFKHLGETIDIHAGGYDLTFPHHENERAQAECCSGKKFVNYWMHNGFVNVESEKMSKSLDNFKSIKDLSKTYDNNTIRLFILTNHYRMPVDFRLDALDAAKNGIKRIKKSFNAANVVLNENQVERESAIKVANELIKKIIESEVPEKIKDDFQEIVQNYCTEELCMTSPWAKKEFSSIVWRINEFINAMDSDFNTSKALAILFDISSMIQKNKNSIIQSKNLNNDILNFMTLEVIILEKLSEVLGFDFSKEDEQAELNDGLTAELMELIIDIRKDARINKNWALADKIRDKLKELNLVVKDNKDGTTTWEIEQ